MCFTVQLQQGGTSAEFIILMEIKSFYVISGSGDCGLSCFPYIIYSLISLFGQAVGVGFGLQIPFGFRKDLAANFSRIIR